MSRSLALDTVRLKPVSRTPHTEYSLEYHTELVRKVTGKDGRTPDVFRDLYRAWSIDFLWSTSDGLRGEWEKYGRATDMGHAVYAPDGSDRRTPQTCPFKEPEEVWAFDAVGEYGLPEFDEQVAAYEKYVQDTLTGFPDQLTTGGYYRTIVSGAIAAFGWDMFLLALAEPAKMERVLDSFYRRTRFHMDAWARTSVEVVIQHDDFVWTGGAFMRPDIYRKMVIPRYAELWKALHEAGKKVLFCSDGNFMEFAGDVAAAGADGFIFEPVNDFGWMVERFGASHCLIGSCVDCRDMTFGRWEKVREDMDRTFALRPQCKGLIFATGNHLPGNIPDDMMEKYLARFLACNAG
jgi:hypothetical protein